MIGRKNYAGLRQFYCLMAARVAQARKQFGPLTLTQKIILSHITGETFTDEDGAPLVRGSSQINLQVDHAALQDATAQMALLQLSQFDKPVAVPTTVHLDHLITAKTGMLLDLSAARSENEVVYEFLRTAAARWGIGYWGAGAGIIHQIVAENYAFPGGIVVGTDSHTVNAGGMGMLAIGVGGADAVDVMAGLSFNLLFPKIIGVKLVGKLNGWTSAKDIIINLVQRLTVSGGTNSVIEFIGTGVESISATGRMTIANMGAEHGATGTLFPYDAKTGAYLTATDRADWAEVANHNADLLTADPEVLADPEAFFDQVIEIDLDSLQPHVSGPHSPDRVRAVGALNNETLEGGIDRISQALIGSCTNSSSQDMMRAASVLQAGLAAGLKLRVPLSINCGSQTIYNTIEANGTLKIFQDAGVTVMANACGGCIGMWERQDGLAGQPNVIVSSFNRNFAGRNDGHKTTLSYLMSPEMVVAYAFAGTLRFNPLTDNVPETNVLLTIPQGDELPQGGLCMSQEGYIDPPADLMQVELAIPEGSQRLARLESFDRWDGLDYSQLPVLVTVPRGEKCTTDHISAAGTKWLVYRGHLPNISRNTYMRVLNPWTGQENDALNVLTGGRGSYHDIGSSYRDAGHGWVVIGDNNIGEGSSREHAALQPRYLGCRVVIARGGFARIHESNLKKQGILPLRFENADLTDCMPEGCSVSLHDLAKLAPGQKVSGTLHLPSGATRKFTATHTMTATQIEWFRAGSCLNYLKQKA